MKRQLAYDAIALEYGGNTVFLRPSLRAAIHLERLHGGFPKLLSKIEEFDTHTIWHVITAAASKAASEPLFAHASANSLMGLQRAVQAPCFELVTAIFPVSPSDIGNEPTSTNPIPWADLFKDLYGYATGWLGWTPETAWNATPREIMDAMDAYAAMQKAIHGSPEETDTGPSEEQRRENEANGLDPEFDRAGLHALKQISGKREGMTA